MLSKVIIGNVIKTTINRKCLVVKVGNKYFREPLEDEKYLDNYKIKSQLVSDIRYAYLFDCDNIELPEYSKDKNVYIKKDKFSRDDLINHFSKSYKLKVELIEVDILETKEVRFYN